MVLLIIFISRRKKSEETKKEKRKETGKKFPAGNPNSDKNKCNRWYEIVVVVTEKFETLCFNF